MNPAKLSRPLQLDYSIDMKMSRFFLYVVLVIITLIPFDYAGAELGFRSNSKISISDSTSLVIFKSFIKNFKTIKKIGI